MNEQTRIHPVTGERLRRDVRSQTVRYAIYSCVVAVPGWYPEGSGDAIHTGTDLDALDAAFIDMREKYAVRIKSIRKRLRLTQEAAGRIIGGGKRAFQKYESGRTPPSDAAIGLLELLERQPEAITVLEQLPGRSGIAA